MQHAIIDFINTNRDRYIEELTAYLAIPSVSALPEHADDVRRCADWTAEEMRRIGLQRVELRETKGYPIVYGDWLGAEGAPTILFYGHYDVQPVDPIDLWESPPFEATVRDGEIYARGAADDKGQVFMHFKAIEAHLAQASTLPVNIKIILEGEEEVGSANLDEFVHAHRDELSADVVVVSDSPMFDRGVPSICYGLRGLAYFQIDLRGTRSDLHSGSFGGAVVNPAFVLSQVLAQMKDRSGRVKIPGFYDDVRPLRDAERAEFRKLPFNDKHYRKALGAPKLFGEKGYSTLERVWARPTFEVNGLQSGFTGDGAKTVIPAVAMAKVSMRLVPDQHPDTNRAAIRGLCAKGDAEGGRVERHADARRTALDDRVRQSLRPGGRACGRARLRAAARVQSRRWFDSGRNDVPGSARPAVGAVRDRVARRECARTQRTAGPRQLSQRRHRIGVSLRRDRSAHRLIGGGFDMGGMHRRSNAARLSPRAAMAVVVLYVGLSGCGAPDDGAVPSLLNAGYDPETGRLQLIEFDSDENGTVDTWTHMDGSRVLRIEIDADEDGRIERWEYYDDDASLEKVGYSSGSDGIVDSWMFADAEGRVARVELSTSRDETIDRWEFYENDLLTRVEQDTTGDGIVDRWETFEEARLATAAFDENGDGRPDRRLTYDTAGTLTTIESDPDESGAYRTITEVPQPPAEG